MSNPINTLNHFPLNWTPPTDWICSICLDKQPPNEKLESVIAKVVSLHANVPHFAHIPCMSFWLRENSTCPDCRSPISQETRTWIVQHLNQTLNLAQESEIPETLEILQEESEVASEEVINEYQDLENYSDQIQIFQEILEYLETAFRQLRERQAESSLSEDELIGRFLQEIDTLNDPRSTNSYRRMAALYAVEQGSVEIIERLLRSQEPVDAEYINQIKPFILFLAIYKNKITILNTLINSASLSEKDCCLAIIISLQLKRESCLSILRSRDLISEKIWPLAMVAALCYDTPLLAMKSLTNIGISLRTQDYLRDVVNESGNIDHIDRLKDILGGNQPDPTFSDDSDDDWQNDTSVLNLTTTSSEPPPSP